VNNVDKRNFFLMMSVSEGQDYAATMGFPPPSEDVKEVELVDIMSRWGVFVATDVFSEIVEGSSWFADFLEKTDKLVSPKDEITSVLTVFGMALVNKLAESERIIIMLDDVMFDDGESYDDE
jgi:hypothetical protein